MSSTLVAPAVPRRIPAYVALAAWAVLCIVVGSLLLARHLLTLPTPGLADPRLRAALAAERRPEQRGRWMAVHVVAAGCGCSRRVLDHLLATERPRGVVERVVVVADASVSPELAAQIRGRGFDLEVLGGEALVARYHVEAAPLLIVVDPRDDVQYVGGYTPRKQAADVRDLVVIAQAQRGELVEPLPAFGCAVGRALRGQVDPLGLGPGSQEAL